jgi:hypothetical protein
MPCRIPLVAGLLLCKLFAQDPAATLMGTIVDASGSLVAGAKVEIRNTATNEIRKTEADEKGEFTALNLAPGFYDVTVSKSGFRTLHETNLELQLEQQARMEFHLELGSMTQTVEVQAFAPLINTENAVKGEVVVSHQMVQIPLNGRDFVDIALLTPGVLPNAQGGAGSAMAINGARADNTNFIIDGFNDQNPRGGSAQARPNIESMEEFKMQTTGYSAESGRLAGGVLNMVLKSGGNQFHGALFEFFRNDVLDARNFFDAGKSELRRNQFGGMVSGPVLIPKLYHGRDRTFFVFSWESYRQRQGDSRLGVVPTDAQRLGDFSGSGFLKDPLASGACSKTSQAGCFANGKIPLSRLSPIALNAQAYFPQANRPGLVNDYYGYEVAPDDWDSEVIKIDHRFSASDSASFRYLKRYNRSANPYQSGNTGMFGQTVRNHQTLAGLTYTRTFSPAIVNETRFGFTRTDERDLGAHQGTDYNSQLGLPVGAGDPSLNGFPLFTITNFEALGDGSNLPVHFTVNNFDTADTVTWVKGTHVMKFGGDLLHVQFFQPYNNNNRGTYTFTGSWTGQPYADFLLGLPNSTSKQFGKTNNYLFANNYSFFFEDTWRIAKRLTLNLGLRYELPLPPHDKYGRWTNFIPELGKLVIASDASLANTGIAFDPAKVATAKQIGLPSSLVYPDYKDFAPRFGFAWRPFGGNRTVLRGGYGIFYGTQEYNDIRNALANVFPFAISETVNRIATQPNYLTLANPFPVLPSLTNGSVAVDGFELHAPTPYLQSWNLTIERELGHQSAIEIGYVGSKGTHQGRYFNLNQPFRSAATAPNFPVPYPGWSTINFYGFYSNSIYNAGSVTLRRRGSRGFFYQFSYIYSKSIDDASQLQGSGAGGYSGVQNARDLHGDRGRSDFDIGHSFTTSFSWVAPWKQNALVRGWQLAGSGVARTGAPFTPQVNNVNLNLGEANRPNRIAKGTLPNPTPDRWYDVAAFPQVPSGSYAFGNSGRNILDGPGTIAINLSLYKNFSPRERDSLQFRWEVFNVLNHSNFKLPVVNVNAPNAATIRQANDPRLMQVAMRYRF